jgi:hypothetical protein
VNQRSVGFYLRRQLVAGTAIYRVHDIYRRRGDKPEESKT